MLLPSLRDDERPDALKAFATLFSCMTGFALLETARDALFLSSLPASRLAAAYLVIAFVTLTLTRLDKVLFGRFAAGNELRFSLFFAAVVTWLFWALAATADARVFFALYIWTGVVATLVIVRFWTALGTRFTVDQAKRLFAFVGSGSVLGAIVGSLTARLLSELGPPQTMLFFAAAAFFVSALIARPSARPAPTIKPPEPRQSWGAHDVVELVWSRAYLRRVAIVVLTASVTFTLIDFLFKSTVDRLVSPDNMGEVFSSIYLGLHLLSLVVQLAAVSRLVRRFGVNHAQAIVPLLLALGAGAFALSGALYFALAVKVIDGGLRHSLYRTTIELLFVPVTGELRARIKTFIDVLGQRGGQALASLAILAMLSLNLGDGAVAVVVVTTALSWLYLVLALRKDYLNVFRETLGEEITETRVRFPALDLASMETLLQTLSDSNDRRVLAAIDLLGEQGKAHVIPALILYHPSTSVVLRALRLFRTASRRDFLQIAERLVDHPDENVRAAILPVRASVDGSAWEAGLSDPAPVVHATSLVGLSAAGRATDAQRMELDSLVDEGTEATRTAIAVALHENAAVGRAQLLDRLARKPGLEPRRRALEAMRANPSLEFVDTLVSLLTERELRDEVRESLVAMGPEALLQLGRALKDFDFDYAARRRLPKTIGSFMSDDAARILLECLPEEIDGLVRFKILSALGQMRRQRPELELDETTLERGIDGSVAAAMKLSAWRKTLEQRLDRDPARETKAQAVLIGLLKHKQLHALERVFRLVNLWQPNEDLPRIFRGLQSSDPQTLSSSRELVENLVTGARRDALLSLIDELDSGWREKRDERSYYQVLGELVQCRSETLSALAVHHAGEIGAIELVDDLRAAQPGLSIRHAVVIDQVLSRLSATREKEAHDAG